MRGNSISSACLKARKVSSSILHRHHLFARGLSGLHQPAGLSSATKTITRMGKFTIQVNNNTCTVQFPDSQISQEKIESFRPFKECIEIQAVDVFHGERVGFVKMIADIVNDKDERLPGAVFLRGASVAMMITLQPDDVDPSSEDDKYVLLTVQPRPAAGSLAFTELPAGMLDTGTFAGAAAREIEEECGISVSESDLINMSELAFPPMSGIKDDDREQLEAGVYPSAGGCDEFIPIFLCQKRVKTSELKTWQGKLTGQRSHGEKITLKLVKLKHLWKEGGRDAKALSALALYNGLKYEAVI